jgi:glycosyltransferase involved in cell wall biosynthesis
VGAIPDVITEGVHGLLVPPRDAEAIADAVARLSNDRIALVRMGAAARERVAGHYSLERFAAGFAALYRELGQDDGNERNRRLDRGTAPGA